MTVPYNRDIVVWVAARRKLRGAFPITLFDQPFVNAPEHLQIKYWNSFVDLVRRQGDWPDAHT